MKLSVIIPAHDEEAYLPTGLAALKVAAERVETEVETVVVCEACLIVNRAAQKLRPVEIKALITRIEALMEETTG